MLKLVSLGFFLSLSLMVSSSVHAAQTFNQPDIHTKYQKFNKEIWVDHKSRYFRPDGQHIDRWQVEPGPEVWHIADGGVVQGMLLGAYVLEYSWSKSPESLAKVKTAIKGWEILEDVTGVRGLIARVAIKKNGRTPPDWVWENGFRDSFVSDYIHRADVSGDQYSGLAWGLSIAVRFGTPEVKKWASDFAKRVITFLEANDWRLKVYGEMTEHGNTGPMDPFYVIPNGMHISKILAFFRLANAIDPDPMILQSEERFKSEWYGRGATFVGCGPYKKSDNEFQVSSNFQAYLNGAPQDIEYMSLFKDFIKSCHYLEKNAFDDFALAFQAKDVLSKEEFENIKESGMAALREFPYPKIIRRQPEDRFIPSDSKPIPVFLRVINSWSWGENPYIKGLEPTPEALNQSQRFSPLDYIVVYNMGRAFGIFTSRDQ